MTVIVLILMTGRNFRCCCFSLMMNLHFARRNRYCSGSENSTCRSCCCYCGSENSICRSCCSEHLSGKNCSACCRSCYCGWNYSASQMNCCCGWELLSGRYCSRSSSVASWSWAVWYSDCSWVWNLSGAYCSLGYKFPCYWCWFSAEHWPE